MMEIKPEDVRADDTLRVTGVSSSPAGDRYTRLPCVVATQSHDAFKVWPHALAPDGTPEKIWFRHCHVERVELFDREGVIEEGYKL